MSEANIDALINATKEAFAEPFFGVIQLIAESGTPLWVDGYVSPPLVSTNAPKHERSTCVWRGDVDILTRALSGERALESAYISGRLTISGDMSVMARLKLSGTR